MEGSVLGIGVMLAATSMVNLGAVLQKKAVDRLPAFDRVPIRESLLGVLRAPLWVVGWGMSVVGIVLNMVALGLADISLIQPLNGFGLVVLALASRFFLGERLGGRALGGIAFIVAGVAWLGWSLPASRVFADADEVRGCLGHPTAWVALGGLVLGIGAGWAGSRVLPRVAGVLLAVAAATASVTGLILSKVLFGILGLVGAVETFHAGTSWILAILLLAFSSLALVLQQMSFQKGLAVVVTPIFGAVSVVLPLLSGWLVFGERLSAAIGAGAAVITVGVVMLGETGSR